MLEDQEPGEMHQTIKGSEQKDEGQTWKYEGRGCRRKKHTEQEVEHSRADSS